MWGQSWPRAGPQAGASPLESRDTSAVRAILIAESDAELYARAIENAGACRISAASYLEAALVIEARQLRLFEGDGIEGDAGPAEEQVELAWRDCLSCALAQCLDEPRLFEGADFTLRRPGAGSAMPDAKPELIALEHLHKVDGHP